MKLLLTLSLTFFCLLHDAAAGSLTLGSIQGQDGWSGGTGAISPAVDQQVTNAASFESFQSLRVSNNGYNGPFGGWIFGPGLANAAGEPSSGAPADRIALTLMFRSVNNFADGSNLEIDFGNSTGTDRTTFTAITNFLDADGGLTLRAAEPLSDGSDFYPTNLVAAGLSRTDWHRLDIAGFFLTGAANDYFQISLDGGPPIVSPNTGLNRWATFEAYNAFLGGSYNLSNRIFLRSGAPPSDYMPGAPSTAGGFYFDSLTYQTWNSASPATILSNYSTSFEDTSIVPEPGSVSLLLLGFGTLAAVLRRIR